jgi:hypothetical protein
MISFAVSINFRSYAVANRPAVNAARMIARGPVAEVIICHWFFVSFHRFSDRISWLSFLCVGDILGMAFAAGSWLARPEDAGNSHGNRGSSLKPGVNPGTRNVCRSQLSSKISVVNAVVLFILNFPF